MIRHHSQQKNGSGGILPALASARLIVFLALFAAIFGIGTLVQVSSAAAKGSRIHALEKNVAEQKEMMARMELKLTAEISVREIDKKAREMGLVPSTEVEYLNLKPAIVAKR
jgi:hypothetical protein